MLMRSCGGAGGGGGGGGGVRLAGCKTRVRSTACSRVKSQVISWCIIIIITRIFASPADESPQKRQQNTSRILNAEGR